MCPLIRRRGFGVRAIPASASSGVAANCRPYGLRYSAGSDREAIGQVRDGRLYPPDVAPSGAFLLAWHRGLDVTQIQLSPLQTV